MVVESSLSIWFRRFTLAVAAALSLACILSPTHQRIRLLTALQTGEASGQRPPRMIMIVQGRDAEILAIYAALPAVTAFFERADWTALATDFIDSVRPTMPEFRPPSQRGPPG